MLHRLAMYKSVLSGSQAELGLMPHCHHYWVGVMSLSTYSWQYSFQKLQFETLQLKFVPLEDLFRTKPGVKSTQD